jgi:hypothetical protein
MSIHSLPPPEWAGSSPHRRFLCEELNPYQIRRSRLKRPKWSIHEKYVRGGVRGMNEMCGAWRVHFKSSSLTSARRKGSASLTMPIV